MTIFSVRWVRRNGLRVGFLAVLSSALTIAVMLAAPAGFKPVAAPSVLFINPNGGYQGTTQSATISGIDLTGATDVTFSGTGVTATIESGGTANTLPISITIAPDAPAGSARTITVITDSGSATSLAIFTVLEPLAPTIQSVNPAMGDRGTFLNLAVSGLNMLGVSAISFSGTGVTGTILSSNLINTALATVEIAADAPLEVRDVTITNAFGTSASFSGFSIVDPPPITWKLRSYFFDTRTGTGATSPAANLIGTKIYTSHGTRGTASALLSVFDIPTNTWTHGGTIAPDAALARTTLAGGTAFGKHYAIGGSVTPGRTAAVEEFDPSASTWTPRASMSVARMALGAASLDNKIYAIGGSTGNPILSPGTIFDTNEVFDPQTNLWTALAPMPTAVTGNTATIGYNGKIYVIGGLRQSGTTSLVQIYDVATNTWGMGTPMPTPRFNAGAGILNDQIVVFGGNAPAGPALGGPIGSYALLSQTEIYDPASNTWTAGPAMPVSSERAAQGVTFNGTQIFAVGGSSCSSCVQVLDSSMDPPPTISDISERSGAQGTTIPAIISGTNLTGATSVVFSGTGVTAAIEPGGMPTSLPVLITIAQNAESSLRRFSVNTPTGTSDLFIGFSVTIPPIKKRPGQITSQ